MTTSFASLPPSIREVIQRYQGSSHNRNSSVNLEKDQAHEHLLNDSETSEDEQHDSRRESEPPWRRLNPTTAAASTLGFVFVAFLMLALFTIQHKRLSRTIPTKQEPQFLYLGIPHATAPDISLCRTIMSAQILNYPVPTLIDWNETAFKGDQPYQVQHFRARLEATHRWLADQPPSSDTGLVILLDEQSTWFQLRPEVLIKRYYAINKAANAKLKPHNLTQTIIFAAQDECSSDAESNPACISGQRSSLIPPSHPGPTYLSSASLIGPLSDVRTLLSRTLQKSNSWPGVTPQGLFSAIYTEQQFSRHNPSPATTDYELKIGVDYTQLLSYTTTHTPDRASFSPIPRRTLPADISDSMSPFWTVSGREPDLPHDATWSSIPLLTHPDFHGNTPPMIHHSPSPSPSSSYESDWWSKTWFGPYARWLYTAMIHLPSTVVASVVDNEGTRQVFWQPTWQMDKAGVRMAGDRSWRHWNEVCGADKVGEGVDVFGDGFGDWLGMFGW